MLSRIATDLPIPTKAFLAILTHVNNIPTRATESSQDLSLKLIKIAVKNKLIASQNVGKYINFEA